MYDCIYYPILFLLLFNDLPLFLNYFSDFFADDDTYHIYSKVFFIKIEENLKSDAKVRKVAKIRNRYNQVPHLTQDTT